VQKDIPRTTKVHLLWIFFTKDWVSSSLAGKNEHAARGPEDRHQARWFSLARERHGLDPTCARASPKHIAARSTPKTSPPPDLGITSSLPPSRTLFFLPPSLWPLIVHHRSISFIIVFRGGALAVVRLQLHLSSAGLRLCRYVTWTLNLDLSLSP